MDSLKRKRLERNIRLYYLYEILIDPWFFGVVLISSLQQLAGMTLSQIFFMESVVMLIYTGTEIPSGAFADYVGRKYAILIGAIFVTIGMCWFATMDSLVDAWIGNIIFSCGLSMCSGADRAFISDTLHMLGRGSELTKIQGRANGIGLFVIAWTSLVGGFLAEVSMRLPLYLSIPCLVMSIICISFFTEPKKLDSISVVNQRVRKHVFIVVLQTCIGVWRLMIKSLFFVANNKKVKWIIGFFTLLTVSSKIWFYNYNPYFELVGLEYRYFGVLFCTLNLVACSASFFAHKVQNLLKEKHVLILLLCIICIPIILMGLMVSKVMTSLILFQNVARGLMGPLHISMIDIHLTPENKATVQSISTATRGVAECIVMALYGITLSNLGVSSSLVVLGVTTLLLGVVSIHKYKSYF